MKKQPAIFTISHQLAERASATWVRERKSAERTQPAWRSKPPEWKKREWTLVRRAFEAGARWMLKPFQQVCGFDRGPAGTSWARSWKLSRQGVTAANASLEDSLRRAWHDGRVFLELWIAKERFPHP